MGNDSLVEWLRAREDDALVALLCARPDVTVPVPADTAVLAARLSARASVARACDGFDAFVLAALHALVLMDADNTPATLTEVLRLLGPDISLGQARQAVDRLRDLAIVWGTDDSLALIPAAREVVGAFPAGLGLPAKELAGIELAPLLSTLDDAERKLLSTLVDGPPLGRSRQTSDHSGNTPIQRLLARGLLVRKDAETVELPRQVGLALRGDYPLGTVLPTAPPLDLVTQDPVRRDSTGAIEALEIVRHMESLLLLWSVEPPAALRSGGLGAREQRKLARELGIGEERVALLAELAVGANLVVDNEDLHQLAAVWMPTVAADGWLAAGPEQRWATLAQAWLDLPRLPALAGQRDDKDRLLVPLSDDLRRPFAPRDRRAVLDILTTLPRGVGITGPDTVIAFSAWQNPRRNPRLRAELVRYTLREANDLGLVALGALTSPAYALLGEGAAASAKSMASVLPEPVDHVLVQADLTVVAPGRLQPELAEEIALVADVESAGGATVYRVSEQSVRRALDAGHTAAELHELFQTKSITPIPQALDYLIDDVARKHGQLRGGSAGSFLRCDDEVLLAEVLAHSVAARVELRRIAPTVVISPLPLVEVLTELRDAGFAPIAEGTDGRIMALRPDWHRAPTRPQRGQRSALPPEPSAAQLAEVVRQLRIGDRANNGQRRISDTSVTLAVLQEAARQRREVWIGYIDPQGTSGYRLIAPTAVSGGTLEGVDRALNSVRRFPLHRITSVELSDETAN